MQVTNAHLFFELQGIFKTNMKSGRLSFDDECGR